MLIHFDIPNTFTCVLRHGIIGTEKLRDKIIGIEIWANWSGEDVRVKKWAKWAKDTKDDTVYMM